MEMERRNMVVMAGVDSMTPSEWIDQYLAHLEPAIGLPESVATHIHRSHLSDATIQAILLEHLRARLWEEKRIIAWWDEGYGQWGWQRCAHGHTETISGFNDYPLALLTAGKAVFKERKEHLE